MSENVIGASDADALAAEYVLGTLDPDERAAAKSLLAEDAAFAMKVKVWERRLGELHLMVEPVEPEAGIWQRIKAKLPEPPPESLEPVIALPEPTPEPQTLSQPGPEPEPAPEPQTLSQPGPEPESAPEVELKADAPPLAEPLAEPGPAPERQPDFWPELERAIIEAQSAPATVESSPPAPDATALPSSQPAAAETQPAAEPEAVEQPGGSAASAALKPSAGTTAARAPGASEQPDRPARVVERDEKTLRLMRRRLTRWRAAAMLMVIAALAIPALLALWKYAPERIPPALQPPELLHRLGIRIDTSPGLRIPTPPESQFEE